MSKALRILALTVASLMLGACSLRPSEPVSVEPWDVYDSPAEIVVASARMAKKGRKDEATALLERAQQRYPESGALAAQQARLTAPIDVEMQLFEDQLLLEEVRYLREKVRRLASWTKEHPGDAVANAKLSYWSRQLFDSADGLTACAERYVKKRPKLSRECLKTARLLPASSAYTLRLLAVEEQLSAQRQVARKKRKAKQVKQQRDQVEDTVQSARILLAGGAFRAARDLLQQAAEVAPENTDVTDLLLEAELGLDRQVEALLVLGDRLYLEEQIDAALANWEEALTLRPDDEEIVARIERARTVLERLESLRQQQLPR